MWRSERLPPAALLCAALALGGCASAPVWDEDDGWLEDGPPARPVDVSRVPDAVPRHEPRSRYGNPDSYVVNGRRYHVLPTARGYVERGIASWYGRKFHGRRTASGEPYDMYRMTAAHRTLPLPSYVRVTNLENGRSVVVRVNDRGPFHPNRIIDLSYAAAARLGMLERGTALVEVRAITPGERAPARAARRSAPEAPRIYVQAGAFADRRNAERLRLRLLRAGLRAVALQRHDHPELRLYRVRLGPFASVDAADRVSVRLWRLGIADAHVVVD